MGHGMKCRLEQYMVLGGGARRPGEHLTQTELSNISEESKCVFNHQIGLPDSSQAF